MKSILVTPFILFISLGFSATRTSSNSGPWHLASTWGGDPAPTSSDGVIIQNGHIVTHGANLTRNNHTQIQGNGALLSTRDITFGGWRKRLKIAPNATLTGRNITLDYSHTGTNNPINGTINVTNDLTIKGGSHIIASPTINANRLIIDGSNRIVNFTGGSINTGDMTVSGSVRLTTNTSISASGTINLKGAPRDITLNGGPITAANINIGESARLETNADITVSGNLVTNGNARFNINGGTVQAGTVTATGSSRTTNNGTYTSDNNFAVTGSAVVQGGGKVGFNSFSHGFGLGLTCSSGGGVEDNPLSVFDLTTCGQVLPVSYTYFKYSCDANTLIWQTAQEKDNDYFEIEASNDLINFTTLGKAKGNGTTALAKTYSYTIESEEYRYYRLKQVDYDNDFEYSKIVVNNCSTPNTSSTYIYPTMSNNSFYLSHDFTTEVEMVTVEITNITGQIITSKQYNINNINEEINLKLSSNGTYIAKIRTNSFNKSVKIIKN